MDNNKKTGSRKYTSRGKVRGRKRTYTPRASRFDNESEENLKDIFGDPLMGVCRQCGENKPIAEFYMKWGRRWLGACKLCDNETKRIYYQKNKEKINARLRVEPEKTAFRIKKNKTIRLGKHEWKLDEEEWVNKMKSLTNCPDCGVDVLWFQKAIPSNGGSKLNSGSLDRIVCNLGYVEGNVRLTCFGCNTQKGTLLTDEWIAVLKCRIKRGIIKGIDEALLLQEG